MSIRGTRGAPPAIPNGMSGSQGQLQSLDMGMHRHSPGPLPMPGTGPTDSGGGRSRAEGGQDPNRTDGNMPPDGNSEMDSSDGPMNSGIRARNNTSSHAVHDMFARSNNNSVAQDAIDLIKFLGGSNQC